MRTVASGGMAQVIEAVACGLHGFERRVAIKRLLPKHARDGERRRMFLEEARIGSRLHHGGIVPIFDYGVIDGAEFLAMEFVDGLDALRAITARSAEGEAMPEGIALHVATEVAHALAYVHGVADEKSDGIVHRDVSPPNILLSWNGDVRLSDFGIALSVPAGEQTLGGVTGKPHYMAPEQARGEAVCTAADIYAFGATLDALLGGRRVSTPAAGVAATAACDLERLHAARLRGVSPEAHDLIGDCLENDPGQRPTAAEVAARAGALASIRLGRDGRSALRDWLGPLRAFAQQQGALDELMGMTAEPVGPEGTRTFTVTQVAGDRDAAEPLAPLLRGLRGGRRSPADGKRKRRGTRRMDRRLLFWTHSSRAFTALAVAGATLVAWWLSHPHHQAIAAGLSGRGG